MAKLCSSTPLHRLLMYVTTSDFNWAKSLETHHMARYQHSINSFDWCWSSVEWSSRNLMQWHSERTRPVPEWTWTLGSFSNDEGNDKGKVALPKINIIPLCSNSTMLEKYAKLDWLSRRWIKYRELKIYSCMVKISSLITVNVMISRYCFGEGDRECKCVLQVQNTCFSSFHIWKL